MKIEVMNEKENVLLGRKEIEFEVQDMNTVPTRKEVVQKISALKGAPEELTVVKKLVHAFGSQRVQGTAHIYANKEKLLELEQTHIQWRHLPKAERKTKYEAKKAAATAAPVEASAPKK